MGHIYKGKGMFLDNFASCEVWFSNQLEVFLLSIFSSMKHIVVALSSIKDSNSMMGCFRYKYILIEKWLYIMYIMHLYHLSHKHEQLFVKGTFSKSINFKVNNTFEQNVFKCVIKLTFISWSTFALLIINVKILSNFQNEWCTFGRKQKTFGKNKDCPLSRFECFKHAKKKLICGMLCKICN
jgi:hypothetical protein